MGKKDIISSPKSNTENHTFWVIVSHFQKPNGKRYNRIMKGTMSVTRKEAIKKSIDEIYGKRRTQHSKNVMNLPYPKIWNIYMKNRKNGYSAQKISFTTLIIYK